MSKFSDAVLRRTELLAHHECVRLVDRDGDAMQGLVIDKYGPCAVAYVDEQYQDENYVRMLSDPVILGDLGVSGLLLHVRYPHAAKSFAERGAISCGDIPQSYTIREHGIQYLIYPFDLLNAGLFLDMRDVRAQLLSASRDQRVLNLFSYTGSLGLAALHGGASEVIQVDISQKVLAVARENEALNQRSGLGVVKYIKEDAGEYLARSARRKEREGSGFDLIIIDPPSFARSKTGVFALEREFENLLINALYSLNESGQILFSCNLLSLDVATMQARAHEIVCREGFVASGIQQLLLPKDFTACEQVSTAMRGVWIRII